MRGLAARAPTSIMAPPPLLTDVVNFYIQRFNLLLTTQQKANLVAFMSTASFTCELGRAPSPAAFEVDFS